MSAETSPELQNVRADVLGRLLVVQQTLDVPPDAAAMASYVCRALREVPGVRAAVLVLEGGPAVEDAALADACTAARVAGLAVPGGALPGLPDSAAFLVRTPRRPYGLLAFTLSDPASFSPYCPILSNLAGTVAAALETRELLRLTSDARDRLESLVEERTRELAERSERLAVEVAERARALAALAESEEQLRLIAANARDAIVVLDDQGRVTTWNPAAERIFGRSRSEMLGQGLHEAIAPARYREASRRGIAAFGQLGIGPFIGRPVELAALGPDGTERLVEISVAPVKIRGRWHAVGIGRDIAERKRGDKLRDALAAIVRSTTDAVVGETLSNLVTSWNAGAERLYGYTAEEMIGRHVSLLAPPEKARESARLVELLRAGQVVQDFETRRIRKDGRVFDVSLTLAPILDDGGVISGVSAIVRDITRRKQAERALRESDARLEEAQAIARLGSWEWSVASGTAAFSKEALAILGSTAKAPETSVANAWRRVPRADRRLLAAAVREAFEAGKPLSSDFRVVLPGGALRHVHGTGRLIQGGDGRPARIVGTVQDVTERREMELALLRTNRFLRTLSSCNQTLVRATSETVLLEEMCAVLVEGGGFRRAWVALLAEDGELFVPRGAATPCGDDETSYPATIEPGSPPWNAARDAIRTRRPRVVPAADGDGPHAAVPLGQQDRILGALVLSAGPADAFEDDEIRIVSELADDLAYGIETMRAREERREAARERQRHLEQVRRNLESTVAAIAALVEARDPYTAGHQRRVAALATAIAREMGFDEDEVQGVHLAGTIHDVGKVRIPAEVLSYPGRLSEVEMGFIRLHPEAGHAILSGIDFPWPIAQTVLQHHERMDGSGYPRGLSGDQISLPARILAVADTVEAMASHRPYRPSRGLEIALAQIESDAGVVFDRWVVDACLRLFREKGYEIEERGMTFPPVSEAPPAS